MTNPKPMYQSNLTQSNCILYELHSFVSQILYFTMLYLSYILCVASYLPIYLIALLSLFLIIFAFLVLFDSSLIFQF